MPYSIVTKDGIEINNIPDDVPEDDEGLKQRVAKIREEMKLDALSTYITPQEEQPAPVEPTQSPQQWTVGETTQMPEKAQGTVEQLSKPVRSSTAEAPQPEAEKYSFEMLSQDDNLFNKINKYAVARFGQKEGGIRDGESRQDYIKRFGSHMRMLSAGNLIDATREQEWLNDASTEDVAAAGAAYDVWEKTAGMFSEEGQSGIRPYFDYAKAVATDPLTLISGGVSKGAALAARTAGKKAPLFFIPAVEAGGAALQDTLEQKREIAVSDATARQMRSLLQQLPEQDRPRYEKKIQSLENRVEEGVKAGSVGTAAAFGATFGLIEPAALMAASRKANLLTGGNNVDLTVDDILQAREVRERMNLPKGQLTGNEEIDTAVQATTSLIDGKSIDDISDALRQMYTDEQLDPLAQQGLGRQLLSDQGQPTAIAEMQVKNSIGKQATLIAENVWRQMPELGIQEGELTSNAIVRTLGQISDQTVPQDVLESAMLKADIDFEEFTTKLMDAGLEQNILKELGEMYGESVSDAARTLQALSVVKRLENKAKNIDPAVYNKIKRFYQKGEDGVMMQSYLAVKDFVIKADKNMIVGMTTNAATVSRNAFGMMTNATYGVGQEAVESVVFSIGKRLAEKAAGKPATGSIGKNIRENARRSLDLLFYLNEPTLTSGITQKALNDSPALMSKLLVTAEELKNSDLYRPVQILNTPAMMMDKFVRQAVFSNSLDKQIRRQGLKLSDIGPLAEGVEDRAADVFDFFKSGKNIPVEMLRKAVDDSVAFTFSKHPTNPVLSGFVKLVEATRPVSSLAFPFARFMANAAEWTYTHYNPGRILTGITDLADGVRMAKRGNYEEGLGAIQRASEKISQASVGLATTVGAYYYRSANQDTDWNEVKSDDGSIVDTKYLFPINIPLAIADFVIKIKEGRGEEFKVRELIEAVVGYKSTVGTQNWILDKASEVFGNVGADTKDEVLFEKMETLVGEVFGQFVGRAFVPLNQVSDMVASFDRDEGLPRDAYVLQPGEKKGFFTSVTKQIQKNIPILKQALPEYQPPTRELAAYRDSGALKQLTGLTVQPRQNAVEEEIDRLNIPYQTVFRTTGDRTVDAAARKIMASVYVPATIPTLMETDAYKNASRDGQILQMSKMLKEAQSEAKKLAKEQSIADAYNRGEVPEIFKLQYNRLNTNTKRAAMDVYQRYFGINFNEDPDIYRFQKLLEIAKQIKKDPLAFTQNFAAGGMAKKAVTGLVKGLRGVAKQSPTDMLQEMQEAAARASKTVEEPPVVPKEVMDEALPAPKSTNGLPDVSPLDIETAPSANKVGGIDVDPVMWKQAQEKTKELYGGVTDELKNLHPQHYDNTVFQQYQSLSKDWDAPKPHKDVGDMYDFENEEGVVEFSAKDIKKDWELNASEIDDIDIQQPSFVDQENISLVQKGDFRNLYTTQERDAALSKLKQLRKKNVDALKATRRFDENDSIVIGKSIGEFRKKFQREVDPSNEAEVNAFNKIVKAEQKNYDTLKKKYKDTPDITLYHGQEGGTEKLRKSGFMEPAKHRKKHSELNIGAPSFTRDINMNFEQGAFGGKTPENYVAVKMPYADYEFSRVNMSDDEYMTKDLNTVAQVITGTDEFRPLSLPSKSFTEMEDAIVEAEKLKPKADEFNIGEMVESRKAQQKKGDTIANQISEARIKFEKTQSVAEANKIYSLVRKYMVNALGNAERTSTKAGIGQRYRDDLVGDDFPVDNDTLYEIKDILEENGSYQRANAIDKLAGALYTLRKSGDRDKIKKAIQQLISIPQKEMAKGGFASRK